MPAPLRFHLRQHGFQAAGFAVNEQAASTMMGTAFAGRASYAEDASIGSINPAGIAFLDRQQVTVGSAVVMKAGNFENGLDSKPFPGETNAATSKDFLKTSFIPFWSLCTAHQ